MTKKILITGISGHVGSYLTKYFNKKYNIIGIHKNINNKSSLNNTVICDIRNKHIINKIMKDIDIVIHTASQTNIKISLENPIYDANVNIIGTLNLLNAAKKYNIEKFIYFSTSAVYGNYKYLPIDEKHPLNPISPYGLSKATAERYCILFNKTFDMPTICIRPFNIYSNDEDLTRLYASIVSIFIDRIRRNKSIFIYGSGNQKRDFVHVKDIASFIEIILRRKNITGEIYNLGCGKHISILELAKLILDIYGKDEDNIKYKKHEEGKIEHSYANITKAKKIGYNPQITIEKGLIDNENI